MKFSLAYFAFAASAATVAAFDDLSVKANDGFREWKAQGRSLAEETTPTTIDVYFHVVIEDDTRGDDVPDDLIEKQMTILNDAYGGRVNSEYPLDCDGNPGKPSLDTSFQFNLAGVTRTYEEDDDPDDSFAEYFPNVSTEAMENFTDEEINTLLLLSFPELYDEIFIQGNLTTLEMFAQLSREEQVVPMFNENFLFFIQLLFGRPLRVGGCESLNIIVLPNSKMPSLFGVAQRPHQCKEGGFFQDADVVVINRGAVAGSDFADDNANKISNAYGIEDGDTLVHEVGHWMGLEHPSSVIDGPSTGRNGCDYLTGDYVYDTPAQHSPTACADPTVPCCPKEQDSCPHLPGVDPVENFMDYASDCCTHTFTQGQAERMKYSWDSYRVNATAAAMQHEYDDLEEEVISQPVEKSANGEAEDAVSGV